MARILVSGASGLIGSALSRKLGSLDHELTRLVRRPAIDDQEREWTPEKAVPPELVQGFDAVVHLAGEPIAARWTAARKRQIRDSRVRGTENLARALSQANQAPPVLISASATGYYGDRGDEILTEDSASGVGFLSEVCRQWEAATASAVAAGVLVIHLRLGLVLATEGGLLRQLLPVFRLGAGGKVGSGRQWWSWIHIDDLTSAIAHLLGLMLLAKRSSSQPDLRGPVNLVSPQPVRNAEFAGSLAAALDRLAFMSLPALVARLALGELAREGPLASTRVVPAKLLASGFEFRYPRLGQALADLLRTPHNRPHCA